VEPPDWLRPDQRLSFQRLLAAVLRFNGALLADGVGTGKTFIALAVAASLEPRRPIQVLAPAALLPQWKEAAARIGILARLHSHETLSRGRPPTAEAGVVIIDESHRFRTPTTRRYSTLAPWCVGRRGILLTATPAVNRLLDVTRQLLLFVRDDALRWSGVPSLVEGLERGAPEALAHLVITGEDRSGLLPGRSSRAIESDEPPDAPFWEVYRGIMNLRLSEDRVTAGLIRSVLLQALASSPAALFSTLRRYRQLLLHARDAGAAGGPVSRSAIRRLVGANSDQLVLWSLVAAADEQQDLAVCDLEPTAALEAQSREWCSGLDRKRAALASLIADARPTLVFTTSTATVRHLRDGLGVPRVAWCTGKGAGLDRSTLPRDVVLDWFRRPELPADRICLRPRLLVATDVAAEGLDLPLLERVVHYDLPWTAVRLDQRSGRALRIGSSRPTVEVVRFRPPLILESLLRTEDILEAKAVLPIALGLGVAPDAPWRVRAAIAADWEGVPTVEGTSMSFGMTAGVVAGFRLSAPRGAAREVVLARTGEGWTASPATIAALLESARHSDQVSVPDPAKARAALRGLSGVVRSALRAANGVLIPVAPKAPSVRAALRRLIAMARQAARSRDTRRLDCAERGIRFLRRGHTAGETRMAESWATAPESVLLSATRRLSREKPEEHVDRIELIGLLLIEAPRPVTVLGQSCRRAAAERR
jgi:superfamily II DNA or RNA helicase